MNEPPSSGPARCHRGLDRILPVSSTGPLTIAEKLLGLRVNDGAVTAFTAIIQVGAIAAVLVYFRTDIAALTAGWTRGLVSSSARPEREWRFGWYVVAGSIPIGIVGLAGKHLVADARSLWFVAVAVIGWSAVMWFAEHTATHSRGELDLRLRDVVWVGLLQCVALIPGVSRSGAHHQRGPLGRSRPSHRHPAVVVPGDSGDDRRGRL